MCIETYSTEQPIQIPYAHENLRFLSPTSLRGRYILLVRNAGFKPIKTLAFLFPREVITCQRRRKASHSVFKLSSYQNILSDLPDLHEHFRKANGNRLQMDLPDPNNPLSDLPLLNGYHDDSNIMKLEMPHDVRSRANRCSFEFRKHGFSAWNFVLDVPIAPGDAHWLAWEMEVENVGCVVEQTKMGPTAFHEIASPIDVRRTIVENLQNSLRDIETSRQNTGPDNEKELNILNNQEQAVEAILNGFGLLQERRVDIQYYELTVETGNPKDQFLVYCIPQGDIRLRSRSPRIGDESRWDEGRKGEPFYEWKSGSILEPAHPWKNTGFSLRLGLAFNKEFLEKAPKR